MGKNLKGKELGTGISQRKDGLYTARFTDRQGKRRQKYFKKLQECRNWIAEAQFQDEHGSISALEEMTVSSWFDYWIENFKSGIVKTRTVQIYKDRFEKNIREYIGNMLLSEISPIHCQNVLNAMSEKYCTSTIMLTRITMHAMFECAADSGLLSRNPVSKKVKCAKGKEPKKERVMSVGEQRAFLAAAEGRSRYNQYALVLQTGLRTGELTALTWGDVDFEKNILHVRRSADYRNGGGKWEIKTPKSRAGIRDIPLSREASRILKEQKAKMQALSVVRMEYKDFVFLSKNGNPIKNSTYNEDLDNICRKACIEHISMHTLRHTFATRCAEAGMKPKTMQAVLGHSNIGITMNIYVHCTDEMKAQEMKNVEASLIVV